MAIEEQLLIEEEVEQPENTSELLPEEETDLKIAVSLAENLIDDSGREIIEQAQASSDPGQVIGQFLFQLVSQMGEQLPFEMSPRIYFAEGGWIEQVSDYIQEQYGVDKKTMDRAEIYIGTSAEQMAQGAQGQQAPPQTGMEQPAQPAVMPQQGMV